MKARCTVPHTITAIGVNHGVILDCRPAGHKTRPRRLAAERGAPDFTGAAHKVVHPS